MNLWLVNSPHKKWPANAVVAAETERDAYNVFCGASQKDWQYTEFMSMDGGSIKHIGQALVGQLPAVIICVY